MPKVLRAEAEKNLRALHAERARVCSLLEAESGIFFERWECASDRQIRRYNLVYRLLQHQIQYHEESNHAILQHKLAAMELVQRMVGKTAEDEDLRLLTIAVTEGRLVDATVRLIWRGLEAMRELNGRRKKLKHTSSSSHENDPAVSTPRTRPLPILAASQQAPPSPNGNNYAAAKTRNDNNSAEKDAYVGLSPGGRSSSSFRPRIDTYSAAAMTCRAESRTTAGRAEDDGAPSCPGKRKCRECHTQEAVSFQRRASNGPSAEMENPRGPWQDIRQPNPRAGDILLNAGTERGARPGGGRGGRRFTLRDPIDILHQESGQRSRERTNGANKEKTEGCSDGIPASEELPEYREQHSGSENRSARLESPKKRYVKGN